MLRIYDLADRGNDRISLHARTPTLPMGMGLLRPDWSAGPSSILMHLRPVTFPLRHHFHRRSQELNLDAFINGRVHFFFKRRHFLSGPAVKNCDTSAAEATECARSVDGNVSAADYHGFLDTISRFAQGALAAGNQLPGSRRRYLRPGWPVLRPSGIPLPDIVAL